MRSLPRLKEMSLRSIFKPEKYSTLLGLLNQIPVLSPINKVFSELLITFEYIIFSMIVEM